MPSAQNHLKGTAIGMRGQIEEVEGQKQDLKVIESLQKRELPGDWAVTAGMVKATKVKSVVR